MLLVTNVSNSGLQVLVIFRAFGHTVRILLLFVYKKIKNKKLYLSVKVFSTVPLIGDAKTSEINTQTEHNMGFENGATVKQIQVVRAGLEPGGSGLRVRRPNHYATPPPRKK